MEANQSDQQPDVSQEKRVGFRRPTLIIPPPRVPNSPTSPKVLLSVPLHETPQVLGYGRKTSQFMFDHITHFKNLGLSTAKTSLGFGEKCAFWLYNKVKVLSKKWFTHCFLTIVLVIYTIGGALSFKALEGPFEGRVTRPNIRDNLYKVIVNLTESSELLPWDNQTEEWRKMATIKMDEFIQQIIEDKKIEDFIKANRGDTVWTIWNSIVFCATIYTTIGYGHMYPKTTTGRALSIVYALIGIPLFLIALTDFGKLFTRGIKFVWSFVRRLYYTGSCRKVRKDGIFRNAQNLYDYATHKRPSFFDPTTPGGPDQDHSPTTPAISNFEIDDEFNLPISVALFILVSYIFCGACLYMVFEKWNFFESFYFVFISMSTIGFGDYVPRDPAFMIGSIVYLVFGLALMSMCINVVQAKLSDTFKQASAKIGATIGFQVDEEGSVITAPVEEDVVGATRVENVDETAVEGKM